MRQFTDFRMFKRQFLAPEDCRDPVLAQRNIPTAAGLSVIDPGRGQATTNRSLEHDHEIAPQRQQEGERSAELHFLAVKRPGSHVWQLLLISTVTSLSFHVRYWT